MSVDRRELVFDRLQTLIIDTREFKSVVRNRGLLQNEALPAIIILDGDEAIKNQTLGKGRPRLATSITILRPEIFILAKDKRPGNAQIGTTLNYYRAIIIRAIAADTELLDLLGPNGELTYDGCETDLKSGMTMEGEMKLAFSLACPMNPNA